jgi:molecular chaperone Hsp33
MLLSLGRAEVNEILEQEGEISVTCEFCNSTYRFDQIDIEQIFREGGIAGPSATTH